LAEKIYCYFSFIIVLIQFYFKCWGSFTYRLFSDTNTSLCGYGLSTETQGGLDAWRSVSPHPIPFFNTANYKKTTTTPNAPLAGRPFCRTI